MVEDLFMEEMFPRHSADEKQPKQYAFIEKARLTIAGEKKVDPFNFTPSVSLKHNLCYARLDFPLFDKTFPLRAELRQTQQH